MDYLCANFSGVDFVSPALHAALERERTRNAAARAAALAALAPSADPSTTFYVATDGSDANPGTLSQPFATLTHAAEAVRALGPRTPGSTAVLVRAGTYYLGASPLVLSEADSNVTWAAYPGDAPAPVVLSGAVHLGALSWQPWGGGVPGILVAAVNVSVPEGRNRRRAPSTPGRAGPPPLVASLFVDGVRQVRVCRAAAMWAYHVVCALYCIPPHPLSCALALCRSGRATPMETLRTTRASASPPRK